MSKSNEPDKAHRATGIARNHPDRRSSAIGQLNHRRYGRRRKVMPHHELLNGAPAAPLGQLGWLKLSRFCELSGYSEQAVRSKIRHGHWLEGVMWLKPSDGRLHINWEAYQAWVRESA